MTVVIAFCSELKNLLGAELNAIRTTLAQGSVDFKHISVPPIIIPSVIIKNIIIHSI